jgi:hypothetical protein
MISQQIADALGTPQADPANKSCRSSVVLGILAIRERRLDVALAREVNAIAHLTNYCIANSIALHAQAAPAKTFLPRQQSHRLLLLNQLRQWRKRSLCKGN